MDSLVSFCGGCFSGLTGSSSSRDAAARPMSHSINTLVNDNPGNVRDFYNMDRKELGAGSYGSVCKAEHKKSKSVRALKTVKKGNDAKIFERLLAEIEIMKKVDHPSIIKLYEKFEDKMYLYLAMELCEGGELFDKIVGEGHFTETQAAVVMKQMIGSVFYLHTHQICHRDLKPENFLFQYQRGIEDNLLKLIDFGLAKEYKEGEVLKTKSGTPYYVSPQVLAGSYNQLCDVWSAGVIMYVLLCGYPPFIADTDPQVLQKVRAGKFEFKQQDWQGVSNDAKDLIVHMLKMNPKDRYTAKQALEHVWIQKKAPKASNEPLQTTSLGSLRNFRSASKFKKVALQMIATNLSEDKIKNLRQQFLALDKNGDGELSIKEISDGMAAAGMKPADVKQILEGIDLDKSGTIEYKEFLAATLEGKHYLQEDALWSAFCAFDKNGDGKISIEELKEALHSSSEANQLIGEKSVQQIMKECDTDGSGMIEFEEFVQMMRK